MTNLPRRIKLMTKKETMQCRKVKAVIRYHKPKMTTEPERYFHHLLILFYPWRCESDLRGPDGSFSSKFRDRTVIEIIETNRIKFEPCAEAVDAALQCVQNNPQYSLYGEHFNASGEQENSEVQNQSNCLGEDLCEDEQLAEDIALGSEGENLRVVVSDFPLVGISEYHASEVSDDDFRAMVRCLNDRQRDAFEFILTWCRKKWKSLGSEKVQSPDAIYVFITGGGLELARVI